jgi:fructose-bisphosphate aldolase class I
VPFFKVDKGLEAESDGVSLMRPIPELDTLLDRAVKLGVFGTKMRSTINLPSKSGIAAIAKQAVRDLRTDREAQPGSHS